MVLTTDEYDAAYFGDTVESGGLKHDAGYTDYLEQSRKMSFNESNPGKLFNKRSEQFKKLLETEGLEELQIIELGGGPGDLAEVMLEDNFDWTVVDVSPWCQAHSSPFVPAQNFILQDAQSYLEAQSNNSIDAIVSARFIECLDDIQAQALFDEIRRVTQKQIHFVSEQSNPLFYNVKTLEQWRDTFNFGPPNRVTLVSSEDGRVLKF